MYIGVQNHPDDSCRGCGVVSRLGNLYPERVIAFAFLSVGYICPSPEADFSTTLAMSKQAFGYELFGYWLFLSEDGADKVIENYVCLFPCSCVHLGMNIEQWDSFLSLVWPRDPMIWRTDMCPVGAAKAWILADKQTPLPWYMTKEVGLSLNPSPVLLT
jgi:soluble epoxide hydrolase / lipid-phosphate phosphatase